MLISKEYNYIPKTVELVCENVFILNLDRGKKEKKLLT